MKQKLGLCPWLTVWTRPRATIRAIIDYRVTYRFLWLCFFAGFLGLLGVFHPKWVGGGHRLSLLGLGLVLALPYGYVSLNFFAFCLFILGKLVKGKAKFKEIRAAISWSYVPGFVGALVFWALIFALKSEPLSVPNGKVFGAYSGYAALDMGFCALLIWSFVLLLKTIAEVQRFSIGLSLLNYCAISAF